MCTGFDIPLLGREFLIERNTLIRGLAHPAVFLNTASESNSDSGNDEDNDGNSDGSPVSPNFFREFGAVEVSPSSLFQVIFLK